MNTEKDNSRSLETAREYVKLAHEIIKYHVNNAKRMMVERFFFTALFSLPISMLMIRELYGATWQGSMAYVVIYALLFLLWNLETFVISFLEKQQYKKQYQYGKEKQKIITE